MKVGIVGSGAMGCVFGGLLADAGNEVWLLDVNREHIEAIQARGVRVQGASGDRTVPVHATLDAAEAGPCELVVVATKNYDTAAGVRNARPMIGPDTLLLTLQNGIGNAERLEQLAGPDMVLVGIAGGFGASVLGPGHVHHNGWESIHLGELHGPISGRLTRIGEIWKAAGFNVRLFDDIQSLVWGKLLGNVGFSAVCSLTALTMGEVIADPDAWSVTESVVREGAAVARAKGVALPYQDPVAWVRGFGSKMPAARPSLWYDLQAGRRTEIDSINGGVVAEGAALGVDTPVNRTVVNLIRAVERRLGAS
jgi:2-dehydropantoate 2-reductase